MTSSQHHATDPRRPAGTGSAVVLELSLADGDPLSGTIGLAGGPPPVPFHGWIDLMSAINILRVNPDTTA